jgi:hypothetical protein
MTTTLVLALDRTGCLRTARWSEVIPSQRRCAAQDRPPESAADISRSKPMERKGAVAGSDVNRSTVPGHATLAHCNETG